jgi:hypothetical protein
VRGARRVRWLCWREGIYKRKIPSGKTQFLYTFLIFLPDMRYIKIFVIKYLKRIDDDQWGEAKQGYCREVMG